MTGPSQPPFPGVARQRFARFVDHALKRARDMGMTDRKIAEVSGVGTSTFHRWRRGELRELPELDRVRAFSAATSSSFDDALSALGLRPGRDNPEPEPPVPAPVKVILRALSDPNISDRDKVLLNEFLQMAAERARTMRRRKPPGEREAI